MANVKIISDSSCDLPKELLKDLCVDILPLNILLGENNYIDGENISADEILEWTASSKQTPKTSAPSLQRVYELIEKYKKEDIEVLFIGMSEKISSTCNAVKLAINNFNATGIKVIDSKSLSGGVGLLVLKASEMSANGHALEEIYSYIINMVNRIETSFVIDTLQHLYYGGRCSSLTALFGISLKLKPCIKLVGGEMQVTKKFRGNNKKVLLNYTEEILKNVQNIDSKYIVIAHTGCDDETINAVLEMLDNVHYFKEIIISRCSCVITSHGGPRTLGIFYETLK